MAANPIAVATVTMGWNHPVHGRILELICGDHEQAVLRAVKTLGIGAIGESLSRPADCTRCLADANGVPNGNYRIYVAEAAQP